VSFLNFFPVVVEKINPFSKKNSKKPSTNNSPMTPSASSPLPMHPNASSSAPRCVRTVCVSWYLAGLASAGWLDISAHAPPRRKRQLTTSIERSWPTYLFLLFFGIWKGKKGMVVRDSVEKGRKDEETVLVFPRPRPPRARERKRKNIFFSYQLLVMFSWLTTRILLLGSACSRCLARSMHTSEEEQPIPAIE
jgi:hypothetical protein